MSSTKFVYFRPIYHKRWPPWPLIYWDIFDFSSAIPEWNLMKLDWKQVLMIFYHLWFSWAYHSTMLAYGTHIHIMRPLLKDFDLLLLYIILTYIVLLRCMYSDNLLIWAPIIWKSHKSGQKVWETILTSHTNGGFSNPEKSLIRKYWPGTNVSG